MTQSTVTTSASGSPAENIVKWSLPRISGQTARVVQPEK